MTNTTTANLQPKIRIVRPVAMPVIYAEGIAQMMVGFPNSRIMLSQLSQQNGEGEEKEDVHHAACELVVPTAALIEMAQGILNNMGSNKSLLKNATTEWLGKVEAVVETLPEAPDTPAQEP